MHQKGKHFFKKKKGVMYGQKRTERRTEKIRAVPIGYGKNKVGRKSNQVKKRTRNFWLRGRCVKKRSRDIVVRKALQGGWGAVEKSVTMFNIVNG